MAEKSAALIQAWLLAFLLLGSQGSFAAKIIELPVQGAIGPATADYIIRGIAKGQDAELILLKLDTPGGLDKSMRQIVQGILTSATPVVVYVAPGGARAASAGTYLLYAGTVAAMAPGTHIGAASPVSIGGAMGGKDKESAMKDKITNDAVAYIRTLAQLRGRDPEFAEKAVLNADTLTADEALQKKVINYVAKNRQQLLSMLDGVTVIQDGRKIQLQTKDAEIETISADWRMRFLQAITDPTIAYLLLLLGIYGIFFELMNPGFIAPGVTGAVAILVALYALQLLPVNYAGLGLILLGLIFIIAELFVPSFGALGLGGTVAFIMGSVLLIDTEQEAYQITWSAIWAMAAVNVLFFITLFSMVIRSRGEPLRHGTESLLGAQGRTIEPINLKGQAVIRGEIWRVQSEKPIAADKQVTVVSRDGLTLTVEEAKGE